MPSLYVSVSLDGSRRDHDAIRGIDSAFDHAFDTYSSLKKITDRRFKVHIEYTISTFNEGRLERFMRETGIFAKDIIVTIAQRGPFYGNTMLEVEPRREWRSDVRYFLSRMKVRSIHDLGQWAFLQYLLMGAKVPCFAGRRNFVMDPQGSLYPCILNDVKIGDIHDTLRPYCPPQDCSCYTPCESYFGLLSTLPGLLLTLIKSRKMPPLGIV